MNKTTIGGIVTLIIILSSGTTWYIQDSETKTYCKSGFVEVLEGEYEGYHSCTTSSGIRYELCFDVYDSTTGRENYWCKIGLKVEIPKEVIVEKIIEVPVKTNTQSGRLERCGPRNIGCETIYG